MSTPALASVRKAIAAGVAAAGTGAGTAMLDGALTTAELVAAAGAGLIAGFATWAIPNQPTPATAGDTGAEDPPA